MNISAIRQAIKNAIDKIEELNAEDLRPNPICPCVIVIPDTPLQLDMTFVEGDGTQSQFPRFRLLVLVSWNDTTAAQDQLDDFLSTEGPHSIKQVLEKDAALKSLTSSVEVNVLHSYGVMQLLDGGTDYLSAELICEIYT